MRYPYSRIFQAYKHFRFPVSDRRGAERGGGGAPVRCGGRGRVDEHQGGEGKLAR